MSILVWPKIGPKERICPLFFDKKNQSQKESIFFGQVTLKGVQLSLILIIIDYLGIF